MASNVVRRPLPALISLLALLVLTALVWWRVLHRDTGAQAQAPKCPSTNTSTTPAPAAAGLPAPGSVDVDVLNATSRTGLAADTRTTLVKAGFASSKPAADFTMKHKVKGVGEIRYRPADKAAATLLHYYLPGSRLLPTASTRPVVVVILGPGFKQVATKAKVDAALAARPARASASPSPTATSAKDGC